MAKRVFASVSIVGLVVAMPVHAFSNPSPTAIAAIVYAQPQDDVVADTAPSFSSDYAEPDGAQHVISDNTPEDNARPGVYFFRLGAQAFAHEDFTHAIRMYEVAASWAYKPAEYNLGVMYARGQGVAVDLPRAMAWMALAAERDDKAYVGAKELVYGLLDEQQFAEANAIWRELKKTYGDDVALHRAKARWAQVRAGMTGSHLGATIGNLQVSDSSSFTGRPPPQATNASEIVGGGGIDGSVAYRQLRESGNPYDPRFRRPSGTATVQPLIPVDPEKPGEGSSLNN